MTHAHEAKVCHTESGANAWYLFVSMHRSAMLISAITRKQDNSMLTLTINQTPELAKSYAAINCTGPSPNPHASSMSRIVALTANDGTKTRERKVA